MSSVRIFLENSNQTVYTGTTIRGKVVCNFNSAKDVRGIKVRFKCKEHTSWMERESHYDPNTKKQTVRYVNCTGDNNVHFVEKKLQSAGTIRPGTHTYGFSFDLPRNLPSSFDGTYGWVKYMVKAVIDIPMGIDYEAEVFVPVISLIDFNLLPRHYQNPVKLDDEKTVCCWCCAGGNITMEVTIARRALVVGESVDVKVHITNLSTANITKLQMELTESLTSKVRTPKHAHKEENDLLLSGNDTGVGAHGERTYNLQVDLPTHIVVHNLTGCELFKKTYTIKFTAVLDGCHADLELSTHPKLGHIQVPRAPPVNNMPPSYPGPSPSAPTAAPTAPTYGFTEKPPAYEGVAAPSAPLPDDDNDSYETISEPPSYEEASKKKKKSLFKRNK